MLVDLGGIISHGGSPPVITLFVSEASRVSVHLRRCIHLHFSSPHWDFLSAAGRRSASSCGPTDLHSSTNLIAEPEMMTVLLVMMEVMMKKRR